MPRRYRKNRRYRRRRRRPPPVGTVVSLSRQPFPQSFMTRHRYCTQFSLNVPVTGNAVSHVFSANSLYDPDVTGVGHQPLGFDNLAAIYNHYLVKGAKITIRGISANDSAVDGALMVGITLDSDETTLSGVDDVIEQGNTAYKLMPNKGNGQLLLSKTFSAKKQFGVKDLEDAPAMHGRSGGNPTERQYFRVWAAPLVAGADALIQYFHATIEYTALWTEPKDLAGS